MRREKEPRAKSQTLSLRLDPKTRFVLEFLAKLKRQNITTVVEEAIRRVASEHPVNPMGLDQDRRTWKDYWDVIDGVRVMRMLADPEMPSDYQDDELREFIAAHIEFFSETYDLSNPDRINVSVLWPNIDEYVSSWRESKRTNPWAAGALMVGALTEAEVEPPQWPRKTKHPPRPSDLDERAPF
jgi:hypothetical protein